MNRRNFLEGFCGALAGIFASKVKKSDLVKAPQREPLPPVADIEIGKGGVVVRDGMVEFRVGEGRWHELGRFASESGRAGYDVSMGRSHDRTIRVCSETPEYGDHSQSLANRSVFLIDEWVEL